MICTMTDASETRRTATRGRILVAPDSFKGTLTASAIVAALAGPLREAGYEVDGLPLGDGGEGTAEALLATAGGRRLEADAHDPLGRPLRSWYALVGTGEAMVEAAAASGLSLIAESERDPERASTRGTGELIADASRRASTVLIGVGGSATTDGGRGALEAIAAAGGLGAARLVCLCDVRTPWELAAREFAPQKGADRAAVARLSARLQSYATQLPRDPTGVPLTGAAGGLAGGLWATHGAELADGARYIAERVGLDDRIRDAVAVVTGEGRLDATTLEGKTVSEVARRATAARVPLHAVVGQDASTEAERRALALASVREASTAEELTRAATALARELAEAAR
ncbi:MAG TPA: glycerate kinase [Solirubrobacterales bacterium]|jgi:glycerate kinase|nr:glycerate kinase [Solirubrobacterales bacterium]